MRRTKEERMEFSDDDIISALEQKFGVSFAGSSVSLVFDADDHPYPLENLAALVAVKRTGS